MKKITINLIVFIILLFSVFTFVQSLGYRAANADFVSCAVDSDTGYYYLAGSLVGQDVIYRLDSSGRVVKLYMENFSGTKEKIYDRRINDMCFSDALYYVASARDKQGKEYFKLVKLTGNMHREETILASDFPEGLKASKLNIADNKIYLTMLSADRMTAYVYQMDMSAGGKTWYLVKSQKAGEGRYFIEAIYNGTVIQAGLDNGTYVLYEADEEKTLAQDANLLLKRADMLASHQVSLSSIGIMLRAAQQIVLQNLIQAIFCVILVIILYYMFTSRFYAVKQFALLDLSFVILVVASVTFVVRINSDNIRNTYMDDVQLNFDYFDREFSSDNAYFLDASNYFNSEDYSKTYDELADFADRTGYVRELVLLYRSGSNQQVLASLNSYRNVAEKKIINAQVSEMINEANSTALPVHKTADVMGEECAVYVTPLRDNTVITKYLVSVVSLGAADYQNSSFLKFMLLISLIVFIITTLGAAVTVWFMTEDIRSFSKAMMADTEAAVMKRKPNVHNNEIEYMWNALAEMTKRYETVNYSKYQVMQAYYRFAPRKIEEVLGRDSIIDVKIGDLVHVNGTMAMISINGMRNVDSKNYMTVVNKDLAEIGEYQTEGGGIIVEKNSNLTYIRMLFLSRAVNASKFGVETIQSFNRREKKDREDIFILLHSSDFIYGVTGNQEQTFPFAVSAQTEDMDSYIENFRKAHAGLVATETVELTDEMQNSSRYIGYIVLGTGEEHMKLYQIFEPFPVGTRNKFLTQDRLFQSALESYYNSSFYEARSGFTEVLKNNAEDEIARWYLFECERYLNSPDVKTYSYGLFQADNR